MHKFIFPLTISLFITLLACNHREKAVVKNNSVKAPHTWTAGTATVDPNINPDSRGDYHPSATRTTDVLHTKLDVRFDWNKRYVYGKAVISARPYFYPLQITELNARGMEIRRVAQLTAGNAMAPDTVKLNYEYDGKLLKIDLGRKYTRAENFTLFIDYVSKPDELNTGGSAAISSDKGIYFINPDGKIPNKPRQVWTQGETESNSTWFPCVDHPNEKMTEEIYITTEDQFVTLSNGLLADSKKNADGTRTDHWRMDLPHAVYLVMMATGDFAVVKDKWKDKEVSYYVEPQFEQFARQTFGTTPEMIDFFSKRLGVDYPWPKYSQLCVRDFVSGAMENTTATIHGDFVQRDDREYLDRTYEEYISHELFHQWFGDYVTAESWANLPLNESFATYGEYLWDEYKYGKEAADYGHYQSLQGYRSESAAGYATEKWPGKREPLIRFHYENHEDMFDSHSYNKGGQVLHLLRQYVGDDAFFAAIKLYLETNKYQSVEIANLRLAFEQTTGQDLNWFFNQWFMSPGHPELDITYSYDAAKMKQRVIIRQTQDRSKGTAIFRIPLSVDIYQGGNVKREEIVVQSIADTFYFSVAGKPDLVNVDAQKTLPGYKKDNHTEEEWAFLYDHSKLYVDRLEALNGVAPRVAQSELARKTMLKALDDPFWDIRRTACVKLNKVMAPKGTEVPTLVTPEVKTKLVALAKNDPKSDVRASALYALNMGSEDADLEELYLAALNDKSYTVVTGALQALVAHYKETGMAEAKKLEDHPSRSMKLAVGNAYVMAGTDAQQPWFEKTMPELYGNHQHQFIQQYAAFLRRCSTATVKNAIPGFETMYKNTDSPGAKLYLRGALSSLQNHYEGKADARQKKIDELKSVKNNATGIQQLEAEKAEALELAKEFKLVRERLR